jgi:hypothetical protein
MNTGDLVKMKYEMWWKVRNRKADYISTHALVIDRARNAIKLLHADGNIKCSLADQWEVVSTCDK